MTDSEFKQASAPGPASASASASTPGQGNAYGHLKRVLFAPDAKTADGGERPMSRRRRERLRLRALEVEEDEEDDQATNARWIALLPVAVKIVLLFDALHSRPPHLQNVEKIDTIRRVLVIFTNQPSEQAMVEYFSLNRQIENPRERKVLQGLTDMLEALIEEEEQPEGDTSGSTEGSNDPDYEEH